MIRRDVVRLASALPAATAFLGLSAGPINAQAPKKTYVLVHGAYHGAWCWKDVAGRLRAMGHDVYTPTQTGLGERAHLIAFKPTLATFVEDVANVIRTEDLRDVILVGHSFAGSTVSGLADRMPERLRHLVYWDALILKGGEAPFDGLPADVVERYRKLAQDTSGGLSVPPPNPEYFGVTEPAQAEWLRTKLTPHPFETYVSKLELKNPIGNGRPATYVAASRPFFTSTAKSRETAKSMPGWSYREIPTGHDMMLTMPAETSQMLAGIG